MSIPAVKAIVLPYEKERSYANGFGFLLLGILGAAFIIKSVVYYGVQGYNLTTWVLVAICLLASLLSVPAGLVIIAQELLVRHRNARIRIDAALLAYQLDALGKLERRQNDIVELLEEIQDESLTRITNTLLEHQKQPKPPASIAERLRFLVTGK